MMSPARLITILVVLTFAAYLLYSTLASQRVECSVSVAYAGGENSAAASASSRTDALREAQTAACGPLARGMNESIACGRTPPVSQRCRTL
jgi:hypothetical protein